MLHPVRGTRSPSPVEVGDIGHRVICKDNVGSCTTGGENMIPPVGGFQFFILFIQ